MFMQKIEQFPILLVCGSFRMQDVVLVVDSADYLLSASALQGIFLYTTLTVGH